MNLLNNSEFPEKAVAVARVCEGNFKNEMAKKNEGSTKVISL